MKADATLGNVVRQDIETNCLHEPAGQAACENLGSACLPNEDGHDRCASEVTQAMLVALGNRLQSGQGRGCRQGWCHEARQAMWTNYEAEGKGHSHQEQERWNITTFA